MLKLPSSGEIKQFFPNHRIELVKNFLLLLSCIYKSRSVNLNICKRYAPDVLGKKKMSLSNVYTRFIRFFKMDNISSFCLGISLLILEHLESVQENSYVILDRTNWELGGTKINVLQVGLGLFNYSFVPLLGVPLADKKGNSNQKERIGLLNLLLRLCPFLPSSSIVIGDREFIGRNWFSQILGKGLSFVFRVRKMDYLEQIASSVGLNIPQLHRRIKKQVGSHGFYFQSFEMNGNTYFYLVFKNKKATKGTDPYIRLVSNKKEAKVILQAYTYRWEIEVYFKKVKTDGFNLEDLNLTESDKIFLMVSIVGYLYTLAFLQGVEQQKKKPQKMQYFINRKKEYKRVSFFQQGLDSLAQVFFKLKDCIRLIHQKIAKKKVRDFRILKEFKDFNIIENLKIITFDFPLKMESV